MGIFRVQEIDRRAARRGRTLLALLAAFAACGLQVKEGRAERIAHCIEAGGDSGCSGGGREDRCAGSCIGLPGERAR